jgi:hypothetical protein
MLYFFLYPNTSYANRYFHAWHIVVSPHPNWPLWAGQHELNTAFNLCYHFPQVGPTVEVTFCVLCLIAYLCKSWHSDVSSTELLKFPRDYSELCTETSFFWVLIFFVVENITTVSLLHCQYLNVLLNLIHP